MTDNAHDECTAPQPPRKASIGQVALTMFWALLMIGKKGTWERDGARVTLGQAVAGGLIMGVLVVLALIGLVRLAVS